MRIYALIFGAILNWMTRLASVAWMWHLHIELSFPLVYYHNLSSDSPCGYPCKHHDLCSERCINLEATPINTGTTTRREGFVHAQYSCRRVIWAFSREIQTQTHYTYLCLHKRRLVQNRAIPFNVFSFFFPSPVKRYDVAFFHFRL